MVAPVDEGGEVISSSRIREALQAGDCAAATRLLTRPFPVRGTVQHGDKNARPLGFQTPNPDLAPHLRPRYGIFSLAVLTPDGRLLRVAAHICHRPTSYPPPQ